MASVPELMVRLVTAKAAPRVVVPPLMMRVLKLVNNVAGNVFVAVSNTVPAPGVQVLAPKIIIAPPTLSVPPAVIFMVPGTELAVVPRVRLPAISVDPLVKVITPKRFTPPLSCETCTFPETVSFGLPDEANVSVAVPFAFPICILVQVAEVVSTVTV